LLEAFSIRFAHKKMVGGVEFKNRRLLCLFMKNLCSKKTDWVRFAFILENLGDMSAAQLSYIFNTLWPVRSRSASSTGQVLVCYKKHGFEFVTELTFGHQHLRIWTFSGTLPELNPRTKKRWNDLINPLRGWHQ